ncbi:MULTISPECIES: AprI/Inh family metalloprotease inhibitor [unclassified Pseudomonas]|uniref:AprI/Inh family metalloprotease inhibitor n=1 Tax=unclassified Pseudomonas TaxID=196821 RepID=UPI002AC97D40|nr:MULTISPECIES: AprI/Inh family metalloprotease inhibitor [unclassified Pseudomonas]MEB0045136.1 AprI/Inh family metalloprotease inhibitor [Pseudomonas sp. Dout3]MEB0096510.1 AprI/Inh family metalloprotease inhibitor [Pseudomonas sp. DC1.2]WPX61461.1 AprI/Inh family metalloprotease inhibitor [Pseudomonas sp. DC1.2]
MTHNVLIYKATAWLLATLMMFLGDVTMASSLRLADPSELAGTWHATLSAPEDSSESLSQQDKPSNVCVIELDKKQTLGNGAQCLSAWLSDTAIGWFPEPDGIAITGKEGSRIVFFSRQRAGLYQSTLKSGLIITLTRTAS